MKATQLAMVLGEYPIHLLTSNVQLGVLSTLVTTDGDQDIVVPQRRGSQSNEALQHKVALGPEGLTTCINIGSYARIAILQWAVNPYAGSKSIESSLLVVSSDVQAPENLPPGLIFNQAKGSNTYKQSSIPAYTLTIQFSTPKNFDFEAAVNYSSGAKSRSNYTIPQCTQYDGEAYVPCDACNISSYTNYNVTYSCFDATPLCPKNDARRRLDELYADDDSDDLVSAAARASSRRLQVLDDDGNAATTTPATFGMLVQSITGVLSGVLSQNPFFHPSTAVLIFVGCLSGFICLMLLCFLKRDNEEKTKKNYLSIDIKTKARKLLEEDIRHGRAGDHGILYEEYLTTCKKETFQSHDVISNLKRSSSQLVTKVSGSSRELTKVTIHPLIRGNHHTGGDDSASRTDSDIDDLTDVKLYESEAAIIEFLHILFPGRAIFKKKSHALDLIAVNHDYFKMFGGSRMTQSRTIRFLELVVLVLVTLFVDTVFFGVFYPANECDTNNNEVL